MAAVEIPTMKSLKSGSEENKASASSEDKTYDQLTTKVTEQTAPIDFSNVEIEPLFEDMVDFETFVGWF